MQGAASFNHPVKNATFIIVIFGAIPHRHLGTFGFFSKKASYKQQLYSTYESRFLTIFDAMRFLLFEGIIFIILSVLTFAFKKNSLPAEGDNSMTYDSTWLTGSVNIPLDTLLRINSIEIPGIINTRDSATEQ